MHTRPLVGMAPLLATLVLLAAGCGSGREPSISFAPSWSPDGKRIAFLVYPDPSQGGYNQAANFELWVMKASGAGAHRLARGTDPAWSPDGRSIAFSRDSGGYLFYDVYTIRSDGSRLRRSPGSTDDADFDVAWSPDGKRIAFISWTPNALRVMNADGSGQRRLTRPEPDQASWSPDGSRIAFTSFDTLFTIGADGRGLKRLYRSELALGDGLDWSPKGDAIVLVDLRRGIMVIDAGGRSRILARTGEQEFPSPSWSPDGRQIVFERDFGTQPGIYVINADGSGRKRVTTLAGGCRSSPPDWSPDSRRIAFCDRDDIYVVSVDGTGRRRIHDASE